VIHLIKVSVADKTAKNSLPMNQYPLPETPTELSLTQAAHIAGLNRATLWSAIQSRNLRARQIGHAWVVRSDDLATYMRLRGIGR
jgi:hypothetical protein